MLQFNSAITYFLTFSDEFFIILLLFSLVNIVFSILFLELLWPTHFFNQRHQVFMKSYLPHTYQSILLKNSNSQVKQILQFFLKNYK